MIRFIFISLPLILLFLLAVAFGALNKAIVQVDFLVVQSQVSIALVAALFLAVGFFIGLVAMSARTLMLRRELRKLRKQVVDKSA